MRVLFREPRHVHPDVEACWKREWQDVIMPDGRNIDLAAVKFHLATHSVMERNMQHVLMYVTDNEISRTDTDLEDILDAVDAAAERMNEVRDSRVIAILRRRGMAEPNVRAVALAMAGADD